jgi:23S rRNA A2030 N6-methylase RlmJ
VAAVVDRRRFSAIWLLGMLFAAVAPALAAVPETITQGQLLVVNHQPGVQATLDGRALRVDAAGRFLLAAGRDARTPLRLQLRLPDGRKEEHRIAVTPRDWPVEHVQGVPPRTVDPPPEVAARIAREQAAVAAARQRDDDRSDFAEGFSWPLSGRISGRFGSSRSYNGKPGSPHSGVDVAAPEGAALRAPAPGVVSYIGPDLYLTGGTVLIDHGHGLSSVFLHLSRIDVTPGQVLQRGEVFGAVGAKHHALGPELVRPAPRPRTGSRNFRNPPMNYRHGFHAGNHADVLKHVVVLALLRKLQAKPAGAFVLDTHGGRGLYALGEDSQAARTGEWRDGIGRFDGIPANAPAPLVDYLATLRRAAPQPGTYPGSPRLLAAALREQDRLAACELQPEEAEALRGNLRGWPGCAAHARDGYEALSALLPPAEKRGLVLIDPPYEAQLDEFTPIITALKGALARWPQGVYALWYPIKQRVLLRPPMRRLNPRWSSNCWCARTTPR